MAPLLHKRKRKQWLFLVVTAIVIFSAMLWNVGRVQLRVFGKTTSDFDFMPPVADAVAAVNASANSSATSSGTPSSPLPPPQPPVVVDNGNAKKPVNCFPHNSQEWIEGPRIGNQNELLLNDDFVKLMTLQVPYMLAKAGSAKPYLNQTIAFEQSRFMNDSETETDPKSIRLWTVRLLYLITLYHQHHPSIPEAQALYERGETVRETCQQEREAQNIGRYDFECPNAKYIVASLSNNGLGANVRSGTTTVLLAGLITGRIVHFVNNARTGDRFLRRAWASVSCQRGDAQCFFLPPSPCTLIAKDLDGAYQLQRNDMRKLFKKKKLPIGHEDDKVWTIRLNFFPQLWTPPQLEDTLRAYATDLLTKVAITDPRLPAMTLAADHLLLEEDAPRAGYNFAAANLKLNHALGFYSLRPNLEYASKMQATLGDIVPVDLNADDSFGLPIRASDKCVKESECLSFHQHLEGVTALWQQHQNATRQTTSSKNLTVVFTTEATSMVQEQVRYSSNRATLQQQQQQQEQLPFTFRFVTNTRDVTPDTGFVKLRHAALNFTADESMLSAVTSLKFQLLPRVSLGNCCSNFHVLLSDFLMEGLGAAFDNSFTCLQELRDPRLAVCCGWHKQCKMDRAQALAVLANQTTAQ